MAPPTEGLSARIESPGREPTSIASELTIGRAIDNHLILDNEKVSRHPALIHLRAGQEQCPPPFRMVLHFGETSICGQRG